MQVRKFLFGAAATVFTMGTAYAGPSVTVTFKNLGTEDAKYTIVSANETSTYANSNPKPLATVRPTNSSMYMVQSIINPNANSAVVRYKMGTNPLGGKECIFSTHYTKTPTSGGTLIPNWTKSADGTGGAICTATITSTNFNTHAWAVEFTMK